jgi:(2R)-sulfolactate sulfo-lyase subunit beta
MKISANPLTVSSMPEHNDVDISGRLRLETTLNQAADQVMARMARNVNGRWTAAEALRHDEFVLMKLYRSAQTREAVAR